MRLVALLALVLLAACTDPPTATRIGERTFKIDSPPMSIMSDQPNRQLAMRLCPKGYRVLDSQTNRGGPDRAAYMPGDNTTTTVWTIRCI